MSPKLLENQVKRDKGRPPGQPVRSLVVRRTPVGLITALALTVALVSGPTPASGARVVRNRISKLSFEQRGDSTVIWVQASRRPLFTVYKLERPPRLTVDIANSDIKGINRLTDVNSWAVSQVATSRFKTDTKSVARVMINFRRPAQYTVKVKGKRLMVTVTPNEARPARQLSAREKSLAAQLQSLRDELGRQKAVAKAAVDAAGDLRQAAVDARKRLAEMSRGQTGDRAKVRAELQQAERKLRAAERARAEADKERVRLGKALARARRMSKRIAPARGTRKIRDIRFLDGKRTARVEILLPGKTTPAHRVSGDSEQPLLVLDSVKLPKLLHRTLDASEFNGPVSRITSYTTDKGEVAVRLAVRRGAGEGRVYRKGDRLVWEFAKARRSGLASKRISRRAAGQYSYKSTRVAAARVRRGRRKSFSGRRIDLDFKDADLHNILRLLSQVGDVNIITSDKVRGRVTIRMKDVPWDQALDVILRAKGLGQVREGNLIRVAPASDLEREREAEIARAKQVVLLKPLETRLIPLSYAQAGAVLPQIQYMLSPRGKLTLDKRTNMIIARDISNNLDLMERLIRNLDTQTPQVLIEARIVEARTNFSKEIGIQWGGSFTASAANGNSTGLVFPNQMGIGGGAVDGNTPTGGILLGQAANPGFAVNMPASVGTGGGGALGLTLGSVSGNVNINLRLSAMENTGDIRIVSAPKITTLDNVEAQIEQGVTIPFSQVSASGVQTTFQDATLKLRVRPHVTADGSINMKVEITNNEPDFVNTGPRGEPTILKKQARTEMLIKDGDTSVIGGIYTIRTGKSRAKVPWFADIPVLGYFFRNYRETRDRQEVLVFITPRIINRAQSIGR